jgi:hypothetical protein
MPTTSYSQTHPCVKCGQVDSDNVVEIVRDGSGEHIGECLKCRKEEYRKRLYDEAAEFRKSILKIDEVRVIALYRAPDGGLWGVTSVLKPGQTPRDLCDRGVPQSWVWCGDWPPSQLSGVSESFQKWSKLRSSAGMVPEAPSEWTDLLNEGTLFYVPSHGPRRPTIEEVAIPEGRRRKPRRMAPVEPDELEEAQPAVGNVVEVSEPAHRRTQALLAEV